MMLSSEARSWSSATAFRTACPGMEPGRSSLLISAFVSTTTRSLAFIGKDFGQLFLGHASRGRTLADAVTEALELLRVEPPAGGRIPAARGAHGGPVLAADHH